MIGPKEGVPAQTFTLRNTSGKDVRFTGWLLADVTNHNPDAVDNGLIMGSRRWKERAVYQTESGKIVCHRLGCSRVPGEVDRGEVLVIRSDAELRQQHEEHLADYKASLRAWETAPVALRPSVLPPRPVFVAVDQQVAKFFANDPLAKDLLADLQIEDVEVID